MWFLPNIVAEREVVPLLVDALLLGRAPLRDVVLDTTFINKQKKKHNQHRLLGEEKKYNITLTIY